MQPRVFALLSAVALILLMILAVTKKDPAPSVSQTPRVAPSPPPVNDTPAAPPVSIQPNSPPTNPPLPPDPRTIASRDLTDPLVPSTIPGVSPRPTSNTDPVAAGDLEKIALMFRDYRTLTDENPVGTNAEIMKAIMGGNPKGVMFGPPEGQSLNEKDELIDHWGTPYFFHQLSKDVMEIHSAGPDRIMGTSDDVVTK